MFGQKGQEAAPFELLIAVVVMTFVLISGVNVMQILEQENCKGQLDNQMEKMKTAIENVASGEGQRDFSFSMPHCFSRGVENSTPISKVNIKQVNSRQICSAYCPGATFECRLLWFATEDFHSVKCLRISTVTNFPTDDSICNDFTSLGEFTPTDLAEQNDGIAEGQYLLVRKYDPSSQNANICAYKRVI